MTDDYKPLLLLDVDGVLFPFGNASPPPGYRLIESPEYTVWIKPAHGDALRRLSMSFELVWATTWEHKANQIIGPALGLQQLPVIEFNEGRAGETWKLPAVGRYVGERPFVWLDDELFQDAYRWAAELPQPNLLIRPRSSIGLTNDQLRDISEFARTLEADA
jgi:HAD domain in Swiss Army Knife RNA repair proteins